ncbi:MAG: site-specific integrase [Saprospiraceae bacterium]|nr:site-specific integrase [Saprospiraceae bacterium]
MSQVRYNLKNRKEQSTLISLVYRFNGQRLVYSTGQKIPPKFWNDRKQRAKETQRFPEYSELNNFLNTMAAKVNTFHRQFIIDNKTPTVAKFKKLLNEFLMKSDNKNTLFAFIENFIKERTESNNYSKGTVKNYTTVFNHLKTFSKKGRRQPDFNDIDIDFFSSFNTYLYSPPLNNSKNYVKKIWQTIGVFLNDATDKGLNKNLSYKSKAFQILGTKPPKNIYLNDAELKLIYQYDFSENERLEKVRDLFLVGCYTGLRFSDFTRLKPEHLQSIENKEVISILTQKTKKTVYVPLHPILKRIINKYRTETQIFPKPISNQKMNDYLKEIAKQVGIKGKVIQQLTNGGKEFSVTKNKWELVTTHTARRSFATNAYKSGMPSIKIMLITGHSTETAFLKYIKITGEENAVSMSEEKFFLDSSPLKIA